MRERSDSSFKKRASQVVEIEITPDGEFIKRPRQRFLWPERFFQVICALAAISCALILVTTTIFWLIIVLLPLIILSSFLVWIYSHFHNRF